MYEWIRLLFEGKVETKDFKIVFIDFVQIQIQGLFTLPGWPLPLRKFWVRTSRHLGFDRPLLFHCIAVDTLALIVYLLSLEESPGQPIYVCSSWWPRLRPSFQSAGESIVLLLLSVKLISSMICSLFTLGYCKNLCSDGVAISFSK